MVRWNGKSRWEIKFRLVFGSAFLLLTTNLDVTSALIIFSKPIDIPVHQEPLIQERAVKSVPKHSTVQFETQNPKDGTYHFGYDIGINVSKSYREERRDSSGKVVGKYGFTDPFGILHRFEYEADANGFRSRMLDSILPEKGSIPSVVHVPSSSTATSRTKNPFSMERDLQLIGPIPKPWSELF